MPAGGLEGVTWVLAGYLDREAGFVEPLSDYRATILFKDGNATGTTGCNASFSGYELSGTMLTIQAVGITERYCSPDELMAQEADYVAALGRVASWTLAGDELELRDNSGSIILVFVKQRPVPLVGTTWRLAGLFDGRAGVRSLLVGTEITATLDQDGQLAGSAGCNNYSVSAQVTGSEIGLVGPITTTLVACEGSEGIMDQESAFLAALEKMSSYRIEGQALTLLDADGEPLLAFVAAEPTPLVDTPWAVVGYDNGRGGVTSLLGGTELSATFGAEGRVTGSAGCNSYSAGYELDGKAITMGPSSATKMFCAEPEGVMDQEIEFLAALSMATMYVIEGDRLQLRGADGSLQIDLIRAEGGRTP